MSADPPYGYSECVYRGCVNQVPMYLNPADFSLHPKCKSCREKRRTHLSEAFCVHGNVIYLFDSRSYPNAPCGCTIEKDIDTAVWDWVPRERLLQDLPTPGKDKVA